MFYESILSAVYVHILCKKILYLKTIYTLKTPINRSKIDMVLKYKLNILIYTL